ncbi:hypothetical protein [Alkalicoccobacillus murimartini]|uniref:Transposase n=1 Tax=Alkalicoccobacillus murimartini TaxID=171685 RepID=A0ABT9YFC0_9BACI|nr:hypothetical protein [Alkalicoccobacillus murimartini]MDQ0206543.1 hypothetical protein [Alkalicoccobacillus murimartini]
MIRRVIGMTKEKWIASRTLMLGKVYEASKEEWIHDTQKEDAEFKERFLTQFTFFQGV